MKRAVRRSLESMSTIYKILQESFQGIKVVKAFTMERVERRRFFVETKNLYKKSVRVAMIDAMSDPVLEMLTLTTVVDRAAGRLVPRAEPDDLPQPGLLQAPARRAADGDPGPADALRHARGRVGPDPQAGQRPLQDPASSGRRRPDLRLMDRRPKVSENKRAARLPRHRQPHRVRPGHLQLLGTARPCCTGST